MDAQSRRLFLTAMKPRRNEPCACGSGKKYKRCCGQELGQGPARLAIVNAGASSLAALQQGAEMAPYDAELQFALGSAQYRLGHLNEALASFRRALMIDPHLREVHNSLANVLLGLGRHAEALGCYLNALAIDPNDAKTHCNIGNVLGHLGRMQESIASSRSAIALDPTVSEAHNNLGLALAALGEFKEAVASYRQALALNPKYVDALNNFGNTLLDLGELREAMAIYRRAIEIEPQNATSHRNLGNVLMHYRRFDEAAVSYGNALALRPDYAQAHLTLSTARRLQGRTIEAEAGCRTALALQPDSAEAFSCLGELYADRGEFSKAQESFHRAIGLDPSFPSSWFGIAASRKMTSEDHFWLKGVKALIAGPLPLRHEIGAHYALGKYFDDLKQYDQAFSHYRRANDLTKGYGSFYDGVAVTRRVDKIIQKFDTAAIARGNAGAQDSERPIFIVGMPRSGTSLAEHILASHPSVFGAGELTFWDGAMANFEAPDPQNQDGADRIADLAAAYLDRLRAFSSDAQRVVDKMPGNFMNLGLIHAAFPQARIIHMARHPVDICLSIYFQFFMGTHAYSNDLADLAHFYREYARIMQHWRTILPASVLLEVPYEALVEDQEGWSRRMTEFIGLPWDPRCLDFHQTSRVVTTASKWQVRQKIHSSSAGRWRNYEKYLGPLQSLMPASTPDDAP